MTFQFLRVTWPKVNKHDQVKRAQKNLKLNVNMEYRGHAFFKRKNSNKHLPFNMTIVLKKKKLKTHSKLYLYEQTIQNLKSWSNSIPLPLLSKKKFVVILNFLMSHPPTIAAVAIACFSYFQRDVSVSSADVLISSSELPPL